MLKTTDDTNKAAYVRQGLTQYVGALAQSIEGDSKEKLQLITAALTEEALGLCLTEEKKIDFFTAKPILRAAGYILSKRAKETKEDAKALPEEIRQSLLLLSARYDKTAQEIKGYTETEKNSERTDSRENI